MSSPTEVLPLRIVAARFISSNELDGLDELDRITAEVYRLVYWQYMRLWAGLSATFFATTIILIPGLGFALFGVRGSNVLLIMGLIPLVLLSVIFWRWRVLQYGSMTMHTPQAAVYSAPNEAAVRNLECLFAALQLETAPRAFYFMKSGMRRYISERHFFGTLRAALVSKEKPLRDMFLAPSSLWFSHELFIETDVQAVIALAKAKPNRAGAKRTYDYTDAVMSLIEHPVVRGIDPRKHGSKTKIVGLLRDWYVSKRQLPPSDGQLGEYASMIQDVVEKNRAAKS